jgi:hypothetical protein
MTEIIGKYYTWPPKKPGCSLLDFAQGTFGEELVLYSKEFISFCILRFDSKTISRHSPVHFPDISLDGIVFILKPLFY